MSLHIASDLISVMRVSYRSMCDELFLGQHKQLTSDVSPFRSSQTLYRSSAKGMVPHEPFPHVKIKDWQV